MYYVLSSDPLHEVEDFRNYKDAVSRVREIGAELEADGFTVDYSWASQRNMFACRAELEGHRPVTVEVTDEF